MCQNIGKQEDHSAVQVKVETVFVKFRTTEDKMEDEICQFQKFKFCKFQGECKRKHLKGVFIYLFIISTAGEQQHTASRCTWL